MIKRKSIADVKKMDFVKNYDKKSTDISRNTISRRLKEVGLIGRINVKRLLISAKK